MRIWSGWVRGSVRVLPRVSVEAPHLSWILVARFRAVVLVAPDGLGRLRRLPHDLERAHAAFAVRVVLVQELDRELGRVEKGRARLPEPQVQAGVELHALAHHVPGFHRRTALALSHASLLSALGA